KAKSVDAYIAAAPKEHRAKLRGLRAAIKAAAPKAEEWISYGMPYYHYKGRLAYFALHRHHVGLYIPPPTVREHKKLLKKYVTAAAAVRFPLEKPMPLALVKRLVRARVKTNDAKK
ncbi:MAG TPA: DUF1801 domain-containing protein, partial [Candidatus Eisenbacteria bacterium]|nr:DUF1801 domain-containing protein [Candidatus Eisenbacteria bacterium]